MKNTILLILCGLSYTVSFGQNLDFEKTGFEIKAISMKKEQTVLAYHVAKKDIPSTFTLGPVQKDNNIRFNPLVEAPISYVKNVAKPQINVTPLKGMDAFVFANDGSIRGIKNIAYEASTGSNIANAFCNAVAGSRRSN